MEEQNWFKSFFSAAEVIDEPVFSSKLTDDRRPCRYSALTFSSVNARRIFSYSPTW